MKAKVNKNACIGCGACAACCPNVFEFDDDGYARAIDEEISSDDKDSVIEAKEGCPTGAIETNE